MKKRTQSLFIQARTGSTRLPGKVLKPLMDKTLLEQVVDRFLCSKMRFNAVAVLISRSSYSEIKKVLTPYLKKGKIVLYAGSEQDVLSRYYEAWKLFRGDIIIRATADNPLVSIEYVEKAIDLHLIQSNDLTHYLELPLGSGVEVIDYRALASAFYKATTPYQKEHVTPYIYEHPEQFKIGEPLATGIMNAPDIRLTIDTQEDLEYVQSLFKKYYSEKNDMNLDEIIRYIRSEE